MKPRPRLWPIHSRGKPQKKLPIIKVLSVPYFEKRIHSFCYILTKINLESFVPVVVSTMRFFQFSPLKLGVKVSILTDFSFEWVEFHHHHHHHHHHQENINRTGGGFNLFHVFHPWNLGKWFNLTCAYFSDGRAKNHQLDFFVWVNVLVNIYLHYIYHKKSSIHVGKYTIYTWIRNGNSSQQKFDDLSQGFFPSGIWWESSTLAGHHWWRIHMRPAQPLEGLEGEKYVVFGVQSGR